MKIIQTINGDSDLLGEYAECNQLSHEKQAEFN